MVIFQVLILASGFFSLLCLSLLQLCNHVKYVTFDTNLCTRRKVTTVTLPDCCWSYSSLIILGLLCCECEDYPLPMFIISVNSIYGSLVNLTLKFSKITSRTIFSILSIYMYSIALTPATCFLSLIVVPLWLPTILISLSNDIHLNPGPRFQNNFFKFYVMEFKLLIQRQLSTYSSH